MSDMKSAEYNGYEERTKETRMIWKENQWLYVLIGLIAGLLLSTFIQANISEFMLNLIPEAVGIIFGVFVIDRLYRYWERQRILQLIKKEIISNLSTMIMKSGNELSPAYDWGRSIRKIYGQNGLDGITRATGQEIKWLFLYTIIGTDASRLSTDFIDSALTSDSLLLLGNINSVNEITVHEALLKLRKLINQRKTIDEKLLPKARSYLDNLEQDLDREKIYGIPNEEINILMFCIDRDIDIVRWSKSIIVAIDAGKHMVVVPILQPLSPLDEEAGRLFKETILPSEAEEWILHKYDATTI